MMGTGAVVARRLLPGTWSFNNVSVPVACKRKKKVLIPMSNGKVLSSQIIIR